MTLLELLKAVEWTHRSGWCPICGERQHEQNCQLKAWIERLEDEPDPSFVCDLAIGTVMLVRAAPDAQTAAQIVQGALSRTLEEPDVLAAKSLP